MDRIIHGANKIQLKGESMRKRKNIWKKRKTKESGNHLQCKDIISFFAKEITIITGKRRTIEKPKKMNANNKSYKITWVRRIQNIAQVEHSRHRCFDNFIVNLLGAIVAYCLFPKKPCINVQRTIDTQLALFWIRRTHVMLMYC